MRIFPSFFIFFCGVLITFAAEAPRPNLTSSPDNAVSASLGSQRLWTYNPDSPEGKPYFHPLAIPGDTSSTTFTSFRPVDHKWHLGFWFSWKYINGVNFWEPDKNAKIRIISKSIQPVENTGDLTTTATLAYFAKGKEILREKRVIKVTTQTNGNYAIDWDATFTAIAEKVVFNRTKPGKDPNGNWTSGGYAGLCIRFADAPAFTYTFANAEGLTGIKACGESSQFVTAYLASRTANANAKLTLATRPDSTPGDTTPWFTRHQPGAHKGRGYYVLGSAPVFHTPITLTPGKPFRLHYTLTVEKEETRPVPEQ